MPAKTRYLNEICFYLDGSALDWINQEVVKKRESQGIFSKYTRADFLREMIKEQMEKNERS